jgi:hypothetical protein
MDVYFGFAAERIASPVSAPAKVPSRVNIPVRGQFK